MTVERGQRLRLVAALVLRVSLFQLRLLGQWRAGGTAFELLEQGDALS